MFGEGTSALLIAGAIERLEAEVVRIPGPARVLAGIGLEARRLDAGDRAGLVALGGAAGNAGGADDVTRRGSDQHAAGIGDHAPLACRRQHGEELRRLGRARGERAPPSATSMRTG